MKKVENLVNMIFGGLFLLLSLLIVSEILLRKIFNMSLQGVDELSGYALAIGATLAFSSALIGRSHMRIDLLYNKYSVNLRLVMNIMAMLSLALFAVFLAYVSMKVMVETYEYRSTASTAWGTPLIIPQSLWLVGSILFASISLIMLMKAVRLIIKQETTQLNNEYGPKGAIEELEIEMSDFKSRQMNQDKKSHSNKDINLEIIKGDV